MCGQPIFFGVKRKITQVNLSLYRFAAIIEGVRRRSREAVPQNGSLQEVVITSRVPACQLWV